MYSGHCDRYQKKVFGKVSGADFYKVKDGLKDFPLVKKGGFVLVWLN